ncbi:unnamed protein product [Camellia sinensis]
MGKESVCEEYRIIIKKRYKQRKAGCVVLFGVRVCRAEHVLCVVGISVNNMINTHYALSLSSSKPEREKERAVRDGGKGHREDDRSRPRLGSNKRLDAPRHTHLGSNPEKFPSPKHDPQQIPLHPPEVVESPPDLAVLSALPFRWSNRFIN